MKEGKKHATLFSGKNRFKGECPWVRNQLAQDYNDSLALEKFADIIHVYYPLMEKFKNKAAAYR